MNETEYHRLADIMLSTVADVLEEADQNGTIDAEYDNGTVSIKLQSGKQWLVSKHAPTKQLWLASPLSGGLHFAYDSGQWKLADGRTLTGVLAQELKTLANIAVNF